MSMWSRSMYGVGGSRQGFGWTYDAGDPVSPIGPGVASQDAWWFRGPAYRALAPPPGPEAVTDLPAGGTIMLEITCHIAWTSFGWSTTQPGSALDACPYGTAGPYHSGDPNQYTIDESYTAGCALGIANVDDISLATMDNIVIFSVQPNCVIQKNTTFDIPDMMPACTGSKCICAWFWLTETGTANMYMTGFDCNVSNVSPLATPIAKPQNAVYCNPGDATCTLTAGAKRPMYAYNTPTNIQYPYAPNMFNSHRPGYHASWSWTIAGAQTDIFEPAASLNITPNITSAVANASYASTAVSVSASSAASSTPIYSSSSAVASSNVSSSVVVSSLAPSSIPTGSSSSAALSSSSKVSAFISGSIASSSGAGPSSHLSSASAAPFSAANLSSSSVPIPSSSARPSSSSSLKKISSTISSSSSRPSSSSSSSSISASSRSSTILASSSIHMVGTAMVASTPSNSSSSAISTSSKASSSSMPSSSSSQQSGSSSSKISSASSSAVSSKASSATSSSSSSSSVSASFASSSSLPPTSRSSSQFSSQPSSSTLTSKARRTIIAFPGSDSGGNVSSPRPTGIEIDVGPQFEVFDSNLLGKRVEPLESLEWSVRQRIV
ncbi:hypothetical protein P7C70_g2778, partial [Phenoliferia sp. Uapishka_3]